MNANNAFIKRIYFTSSQS